MRLEEVKQFWYKARAGLRQYRVPLSSGVVEAKEDAREMLGEGIGVKRGLALADSDRAKTRSPAMLSFPSISRGR